MNRYTALLAVCVALLGARPLAAQQACNANCVPSLPDAQCFYTCDSFGHITGCKCGDCNTTCYSSSPNRCQFPCLQNGTTQTTCAIAHPELCGAATPTPVPTSSPINPAKPVNFKPYGVVGAPGIGNDGTTCTNGNTDRQDALSALGLGWVRVAHGWNEMQPTQNGPIDWGTSQRLVDSLVSRGLDIFWDFSAVPGWANGNKAFTEPPADGFRSYYEANIKAVVGTYGNNALCPGGCGNATAPQKKIQYWGAWNEPNNKEPGYGYGADKTHLASRYLNGPGQPGGELDAVITSVRTADPSASLVVGEILDPDSDAEATWSMLQQVLERAKSSAWNVNAGSGRFDVISLHLYNSDAGADCSLALNQIDTLWNSHIKGWLNANNPFGYNDANTEIWVTETGLNQLHHHDGIRPTFLECMYSGMLQRPWWTKTFWYRLENDLGFGLMDQNPPPDAPCGYKPNGTYTIYQQFIATGGKSATNPGATPTPLATATPAPGTTATTTPTATQTPTPTATPTKTPISKGAALFVVGSTAPMSGDDQAVANHMTALGYAVVPIYYGSVTSGDASGKAVVVISSSASPATGTTFQGVAVPVLCYKDAALPNLAMTNTANGVYWGRAAGQTQVTILAASHPMANGLVGTNSVTTAGAFFTWGVPNANATVVASLADNSSQYTVFGYNGGSVMNFGVVAPAKRVGLFLGDGVSSSLTAAGWGLFDAALRWVTS